MFFFKLYLRKKIEVLNSIFNNIYENERKKLDKNKKCL